MNRPKSGMAEERKVYTITELTRRIRQALESQFGNVWIEGEVSNLRRPSSGHAYFTLKDESAQISAVLFKGNQRNVRFALKDGVVVRAFGEISVYERSGNYQIIIRQLEEGGQGTLQARFEALKKKLSQAGLFDAGRKRNLPLLPQHVGVVTSPTGAAIRDILNVINRRFPNMHVVIAPAKVQGEGAAEEIAAAIDLLNNRGGLDVLIVGRGGGSLEDLWCFNEEVVALAIARSHLPVISAVGHEIDFTISDFVADLRAPTPSAAAELVVGRKQEFDERLLRWRKQLASLVKTSVLEARTRLLHAAGAAVFREPAAVVQQHMQRIDGLSMRLEHAAMGGVRDGRELLSAMDTRLRHRLALGRDHARQDVRRLESQLRALSPLAVLDRGYSVTTGPDGAVLTRATDVAVGTQLKTRLATGILESKVLTVSEQSKETV